MAKKVKISRKELLKEPDQFLSSSEKAMLFFTENRSTVIASIAAVLIVGLSIFGYQTYQNSQIMKYEALYFDMEEIARSEGENAGKLVKIRDQIGEGAHRNRASLLLADIYFQNEDYDKAQATYLEIKNNSKGLNHQMAKVGLAYTYEAQGEFKKAIDLYKAAIDEASSFPLFQVYWSLARCHENNKDTSSALLILREMQIKFSGTAELEKIDSRIKQLST
ncbi:MAG: tetratricopeptide repeat protein [Nitrospinae bacterium]|nr:tetratricopeptide repeat protein [Nitrospinota bacterium]